MVFINYRFFLFKLIGRRGEKDAHLPLYVYHCLLGVVAQCNTSTTRGGGRELGRLRIKHQGGPI